MVLVCTFLFLFHKVYEMLFENDEAIAAPALMVSSSSILLARTPPKVSQT